MGTGQPVQVQCQQMRDDEWQQESREPVFGRTRTLRNRRTGAMVDEYQLSWHSQQDYEFYLKSFNWRARRRLPLPIVSSLFLRQASRNDLCSQKIAATVYLEHMGLRLSQLEEVPLGEALYVLGEALEGYQLLYQHSGYFRVRDEQICVDRNGRVKVWVNANLARNHPECDTDCGRNRKDEVDMVEQLLEVVSASTDPEEMPSPSLLQFFDSVRKREVVDIGFEYARVLAIEFAKMHQVRVPERFETVMQLLDPEHLPHPRLPIQKNYSVSNYMETLPSSSIDLLPARNQWMPPIPRLNPSNSMPCIHPPSDSTSRHTQPNNPNYLAQHERRFQQNSFIPSPPAQLSLRLEQLNSRHFQESSNGQQTKRKSGNSKNSKNSKSFMIEDTPSIPFMDGPAEDRDTLRSVPNQRMGRRRPNMEQIIYSQCIGQDKYAQGFIQRGGLGVVPRRRLQESSSSNRFPSSNSSQRRNSQRLSRNSKKSNSRNSKKSNNGSSRRNSTFQKYDNTLHPHDTPPSGSGRHQWQRGQAWKRVTEQQMDQWQLDPEIEADMRRYLGQ